MQSLAITKENVRTIDWEEEHYKYCEFTGLSPEGGHITSDFINCNFTEINWYWGLFNIVNFIECKFVNCVFRGTAFSNCKFVECVFENCKFIKDNLDANCKFHDSVAYNCKLIQCEGFDL